MRQRVERVRARHGSGRGLADDPGRGDRGAPGARARRAGGVQLDEGPQVVGALALGVMAHPGPDLDVRLRQRAAQRIDVPDRDEPVALTPEDRDRPAIVEPAVREPAGERPAAATASVAARTPGADRKALRRRRPMRSREGSRRCATNVA